MTERAQRAERWRALAGDLPPAAPDLFEDLLDELARWNRHVHLTAPAAPDALAVRIVDDSLLLLPHLRGETALDIGSGPGIPGLVLAIARPGLAVRTVEATGKKVAFTRAFLARHPALPVQAFQGRAEGKAAEPWGVASTVVSRAFARPEQWIPIGAPRVAPGGRLVVTLGARGGEEGDASATRHGLMLAGAWTGQLAGARRAFRLYERPTG